MSIVASDQTHRIRMAFANGSCKLSVQTPDLGEAQEELTVSYEGDPLEIGFNAAYLLEILKYIPTDEVRMTFKAPERAATCEPVGWDDPAELSGPGDAAPTGRLGDEHVRQCRLQLAAAKWWWCWCCRGRAGRFRGVGGDRRGIRRRRRNSAGPG